MAPKRKKREEKNYYRWAVVFILFTVVIIIALDVFSILTATCPELISKWFDVEIAVALENAQERSLLSNGLSLIGLAISVWATLNIINVLDKKDVEELRNQLVRLKEEHEVLATEQNYNILRKEFENCSSDYAMKSLAAKMSNVGKEYCPQLSVVMQYYSRVYQLNQQVKRDESLESAASEGIQYIDFLLERNNEFRIQNEDVRQFLHYCKGEFLFYKAYCFEGEKRYRYSMEGLSEYEKCTELFHVKLPSFSLKEAQKYPDIKYKKCTDSIGIYLVNTMGESYSKAVQGINKWEDHNLPEVTVEELKYKALFYCAYAVKWSDSENQIYLRNLGCALEAVYGSQLYKTDMWKNTEDAYQKAMNICIASGEVPYNAFYTLLSLNHRYSNYRISLLKGNAEGNTWLEPKPEAVNNEQICYTKRALQYAELAVKTYPDKLVFEKLYALALRDACIWQIAENGSPVTIKDFYERFVEKANMLNVFYPEEKDDYLTEINNYMKQIESKLFSSVV